MFMHGSWFMALAIPAQRGFAYDSWLSAHGSWLLRVALRLLKMAIGVSLAPFSFLLSHGVWRSSPPISWKSAGAASARGVRHSYGVPYRPAAASISPPFFLVRSFFLFLPLFCFPPPFPLPPFLFFSLLFTSFSHGPLPYRMYSMQHSMYLSGCMNFASSHLWTCCQTPLIIIIIIYIYMGDSILLVVIKSLEKSVLLRGIVSVLPWGCF